MSTVAIFISGFVEKVVLPITIFCVVCICFDSPAFADGTRSRFSDLVVDSSLIVQARVVALESEGPTLGGVARLSISTTYRGDTSLEEVSLAWSSEVHDQKFLTLHQEFLLFLRLESGQYVATQYGRSYWPISREIGSASGLDFVHYTYPISLVEIGERGLVRKANKTVVRQMRARGSFHGGKITERAVRIIELARLAASIPGVVDAEMAVRKKREREWERQDQLLASVGTVEYPACPKLFNVLESTARKQNTRVCTAAKGGKVSDEIRNGWIETVDSSGKRLNLAHYRHGQLHGLFEVELDDGSRWRADYTNGVLNGNRTYWWPNGRIWNQGSFVGGRLHGEFRSFTEDGALDEEMYYIDGKQVPKKCWPPSKGTQRDAECR